VLLSLTASAEEESESIGTSAPHAESARPASAARQPSQRFRFVTIPPTQDPKRPCGQAPPRCEGTRPRRPGAGPTSFGCLREGWYSRTHPSTSADRNLSNRHAKRWPVV